MQETDVQDISAADEIAQEEGDFEALTNDPSIYEIGYHLVPTLDDDGVAKANADLRALIEKKGGSVLSEEAPRRMLLAYPMTRHFAGKNEHFNQAVFVWLKCELSGAEAVGLGQDLTKNTEILRHLMARTVKDDTLLAGRQFLRSEQKEKEKRAAAAAGEAEKAPLSEEELNRSLEKMMAE